MENNKHKTKERKEVEKRIRTVKQAIRELRGSPVLMRKMEEALSC